MVKKNVAVLVSGGGTNLQALIDAEKNGIIKNIGSLMRAYIFYSCFIAVSAEILTALFAG